VSGRMTPERAEAVIEEIATVVRDFARDEKGLEVVHLQVIRPSGKRLYISYQADDPTSSGERRTET